MKNKLLLTGVLLALGLVASGCVTGLTPSSWSGVTADANYAYLAGGSYVYAINLETGVQVWRYQPKPAQPLFATPALTPDGQLIVGGFDHKLYSLNTQNGQVNWTFDQARDRWYGGALVENEWIYAANADYNLYALDLHGNVRWTPFQADQALWSTPASDGQRVYVGTLGRKIYAIDTTTGKEAWEKALDGAVLGSPAVGPDGTLYANTYGGTTAALDPTTGNILWQHTLKGWIWSGPVLDDGQLYFGGSDSTFYALDAKSGQELWKQQLNGAVIGSPAVTPDVIMIGTESGNVYFLDHSGKILASPTVNGKLYGASVAAGSLILVAPTVTDATQPILVAFDHTGVQKWSFIPPK